MKTKNISPRLVLIPSFSKDIITRSKNPTNYKALFKYIIIALCGVTAIFALKLFMALTAVYFTFFFVSFLNEIYMICKIELANDFYADICEELGN